MIQKKDTSFGHSDSASALEQVLMLAASHVGHHPCCCSVVDPRWSFSSQLLSIPFLWRRLPQLKKVSISLSFLFGHSLLERSQYDQQT
jgi:ubiquitin-protein ligase E3 C